MKSFEELKNSQRNILIIHFASTDLENSPVIITSISVKNYFTEYSEPFSFEAYGNEKRLLSEFVKFMENHKKYIIVTWNGTDTTYGIPLIARRCKELNIVEQLPIELEDVVDLDKIFKKRYGRDYVNGHPKLRILAEKNQFTLKNFVEGIEEIRLFDNEKYRKIEMSTERKVKVIANCLSASIDDTLKTSTIDQNKKNEDDEINSTTNYNITAKTVQIQHKSNNSFQKINENDLEKIDKIIQKLKENIDISLISEKKKMN